MYYDRVNFCSILSYVAASVAYGSVTLKISCWWTFTSLSKSSKKSNKEVTFQNTITIAPATNRNQTTKTNSYIWTKLQLITNVRTPSIAPSFQSSLNSSTVAAVSLTGPSGRQFFWKNAKLTSSPFLLVSIVRNEENTGYKSVLSWWVVVWVYWLDKEYPSLVWLSGLRAAGSTSRKLYGFKRILQVNSSSIEQLCWSLLVMHWEFLQDLEMFFRSRLNLSNFVAASR